MSRVRIREFRIPDYNAVLKLWKDAGLVIRPGDDLKGIRRKLKRDPDLFLLATDQSDIIGCVIGGWDGRRAWIYHLAVKHSHRRKGVAKVLLGELQTRLAEKGAKLVYAQVYRWNKTSLRLFNACGYETHKDTVVVGKVLRNRTRQISSHQSFS